MISLRNVSKQFHTLNGDILALDDVSLDIEMDSFTCISGHSGSGKTTLMNIIAGYDFPDKGSYHFLGQSVTDMTKHQLESFHRDEVGMIFQDFKLLDHLTVYENIALPLHYRHVRVSGKQLDECLSKVAMNGYGNSFPSQLSGGQKQRVAIARVLISGVRVILADEPTGALDRETGEMIVGLLKNLTVNGYTVIMVTHDQEFASYCDRIIVMENGHVADQGTVQ